MKIPFLQDFVELFFPKVCCVCGSPLVGDEHSICCNCLLNLPEALTAQATPNYLEYRLAGRIPIEHASALLIFKKESGTQKILHQIKYQENPEYFQQFIGIKNYEYTTSNRKIFNDFVRISDTQKYHRYYVETQD